LYIAQDFDHTILTDLGILILVAFLSISTLAAIQPAAALRDSSTATNASTQSFIPYNKINGKGIVILEGATLIDGTGTPPKPDSDIVINRNKIVDVSDTTRFYYNQNNNSSYHLNTTKNLVLNLTGKYIMPGLFDMHAHVAGVLKNSFNETKSENMLRMLLDNGVTTIRNPGGPTTESVMLKEEVDSGKIKGPKIFTAGRLINSPGTPVPFVEKQASTEQEVKQEVRSQASAGVDYVKLYVGLRAYAKSPPLL
jgi:imidazolonepropionase-like amidohydrolase